MFHFTRGGNPRKIDSREYGNLENTLLEFGAGGKPQFDDLHAEKIACHVDDQPPTPRHGTGIRALLSRNLSQIAGVLRLTFRVRPVSADFKCMTFHTILEWAVAC